MNEKHVIGATVGENESIAWFNARFPHSMPLTLNTLNRAILKNLAGEEYDMFVTNKPFWLKRENETASEAKARYQSGSTVPVLFLFFSLLSYWPAVFVGFYIKERESGAKLIQLVCGANQIIFWTTSFLFDFTIYFIIMCLLLGKTAIYQGRQFSTFEDLSIFLIIFAAYGFSMLPFLYLFSYVFKKHSTAESFVPIACIVCKFELRGRSETSMLENG